MAATAPEKIDGIRLTNVRTWDAVLKPLGYVRITNLNTVKTLTPPDGARVALIIPATQGVAYRDDGTNATAVEGMPLAVGDKFWYNGDLTAITFIELAASATLHVSYYGSATE